MIGTVSFTAQLRRIYAKPWLMFSGIASETGDAGCEPHPHNQQRYPKTNLFNEGSYHAMKRYFKKWEKWVPPQDGHNTTGQYTPASHGFDGPIHVSLPNYDFPAHKLLIKAASEVEGFSYSKIRMNQHIR